MWHPEGPMRSTQALILACLLGACSSDGGDALHVAGNVTVAFDDGTRTGFDFVDGRDLGSDGVTGYCTFGAGAELEVSLRRTEATAGVALRSFRVVVASAGPPAEAAVVLGLGESDERTLDTGADCVVDVTSLDHDARSAGVAIDCALGAGEDGRVTADLDVSGCTVPVAD
jgi:hypothetical protein